MQLRYLFFIIVILLVGNQYILAQEVNDEIPKKLERLLKKAEKKESFREFEDAIGIYEKASSQFPAYEIIDEKLSFLFANMEEWQKAKITMEKAIQKQKTVRPIRYLYTGNYCHQMADYPCEVEYLQKYLETATKIRNKERIQERIEIAQEKITIIDNSVSIDIEMLPPEINLENGVQYLAAQTVDGKAMIFTRRVNGQEDFFYSKKQNGEWLQAQPIQELNTPGNEGAHTINADGSLLVFTRCNAPGPYKSCDLYISSRANNTYSTPVALGMVNTVAWESQPNISSDGKTILFSSDRKGGEGGRDLYMIQNKKGKWSDVQNLGSTINTIGDEQAPFLHPDGRTLYFMSDGHKGLGGQDLFMSKKGKNGAWQKPINLGSSINTMGDEGALSIDVFGEYAYFSRGTETNGQLVSYIFRFPLPQQLKPAPVSYVQFSVFDSESELPMEAELHIVSENGSTEKVLIPKEGITYTLPVNQNYQIYVDRPGFLYYSDEFISKKGQRTKPIEKNIYLQAIEEELSESKPIILKNVQFESSQSTLLKSSYRELDRLVTILDENDPFSIKIIGHTDDVGSDEDNLQLSQDRALAVKNYLIEKGISENRILIEAKGERDPLTSNETEEGRAMNRRTEFVILQ